jgi:hypothetical protein
MSAGSVTLIVVTRMNKLFEHTVNFYEALLSESEESQVNGAVERVFRGKITDLFRELKISQTYYSKVKNALIDMGCITMVVRGTRNVPTEVMLHKAPQEDAFKTVAKRPLTKRQDSATLAQRLDDVQRLIGGIDIRKALADHELRLSTLEHEFQQTREDDQIAKVKKKHSNQ